MTYPCDYAVMAVSSRSRRRSALSDQPEIGCGYLPSNARYKTRAECAENVDVSDHIDRREVHKDAVPKKIVFVTGGDRKDGTGDDGNYGSGTARFKVRSLHVLLRRTKLF